MQINLEKLVDVAVELRIATLKADEQGIICYSKTLGGEEYFSLWREEQFAEIIKDREYKIKRFNGEYCNYKYETYISGLKFSCITKQLLFDGDEKKIEEEI